MKFIAALIAVLALVAFGGGSAHADTSALYGAWTTTYYDGLTAPADTSLGYAIVAVKAELAYNGYDKGMIINKPVYGVAARASAKAFQTAFGLYADGVVGPKTARLLFRKRAIAFEAVYGIPGGYLQRIKSLESANDPNAIGFVDHNDHGLIQINLIFHPDVSLAQAVDPGFAIPWGTQHLRDDYNSIGDWDGGIAAWNVGHFYANKWVAAGKPAIGFVLSSGTDIFATCTKYVALVKGQVL